MDWKSTSFWYLNSKWFSVSYGLTESDKFEKVAALVGSRQTVTFIPDHSHTSFPSIILDNGLMDQLEPKRLVTHYLGIMMVPIRRQDRFSHIA